MSISIISVHRETGNIDFKIIYRIIKVCLVYGYDINTLLFNNSDNVRQFRHDTTYIIMQTS